MLKIGDKVVITAYLTKTKHGDNVVWVNEELGKELDGIYVGYVVVKNGTWEGEDLERYFVATNHITCHRVQQVNSTNRYLTPLYVLENDIKIVLEESE